MIVAGCDIGSLTAKAVILKNRKIVGQAVDYVQGRPEEAARAVMDSALVAAGLTAADIRCCFGTGYGKKRIVFVDESVSEIACHGKGAHWLNPDIRTVIDIGGQDCKAIRIDDHGNIVNFVTNDKCAAGTGRFLEVMSRLLNIDLAELGALSEKSRKTLQFSATCTIWVQQEVIRRIHEDWSVEDIGAAVNRAMADRVAILANRLVVAPDLCLTGGVAKNTGVCRDVERLLGHKTRKIKTDPQIIGALGAAIFAREKMEQTEGGVRK
jgi:(R)-2-hydroxyacyl-CoA dehydratese activating ATPase